MDRATAQILLPEGARRLAMALLLAGWTSEVRVIDGGVHLAAVGPVGFAVEAWWRPARVGPQHLRAMLSRGEIMVDGRVVSLRKALLHVLGNPLERS